MRQSVTQRRIAEMAGVSYPTVNRVLNNSPSVRPALRDRVLEVARLAGYRKNMLASGLSRRQTMAIGMVMSNNPHSFWAEVLTTLEQEVRTKGYHVIICHQAHPDGAAGGEIRFLMERQVDGMIVCPPAFGDDVDAYRTVITAGVPLLLLNTNFPNIGVSYLGTTNRDGARTVCAYLAELGHRWIACVRGTGGACDSRYDGYADTMAQYGFPVLDVKAVGNRQEHGRETARQVLAMKPRPTAVFAATDPLAIGLYQELTAAGLQVPTDISVAGYAGMLEGELLPTPLTTVKQDTARLGSRAGQLMLELIDGKHPTPVAEEIEDRLLIRASCAPPRG